MFVRVKLCASDALGPCARSCALGYLARMVLIKIAAAVAAVVIAYVVWMAWLKHRPDNPPWAMREFHTRMGLEPPRRSEKLGAKDD